MSSLETQKHDCLCAIRNSKSNRYELSFISRSLVPCGFRGFFTVRDWRNPTIFRLLCSWFRSSSVSCTTTRESTNFKILSVTFHSLLINDEWQLRLLPTSNLNEGMELQRPFLHLSLSLSFFLSTVLKLLMISAPSRWSVRPVRVPNPIIDLSQSGVSWSRRQRNPSTLPSREDPPTYLSYDFICPIP